MPEIRVALDLRIYGRRGIGRYNVQLLHSLLSLGTRVSITALSQASLRPDLPHDMLRSKWYVVQEQFELPFRLRQSRYDVVHLTANTAPLIQRHWPPLVVTVHDVMYLKSPTKVPISPSARQTFGRAYRAIAFLSGTRRASRLIADSQQTANDVRRVLGEKSPPVDTIYSAIDPAFFAVPEWGQVEVTCARHNLRPAEFFLHPGANDPRKNTLVVLDAFQRYVDAGGPHDLAIFGLPAHTARILRTRPRGPALARVRLLGWISDAEVVALTQSAAAVVFVPSDEGFGFPLLEAMAARTPTIASDIPVLRELSSGHSHWVAPRDRPALAAAMMAVRRSDVEATARRRAEEFTQARMGEAVLTTYERMLRG